MIRKMKKSDLSDVLEIERKCFRNPWNRGQYEYELDDNPYANLWVMELDGRIAGYYDVWVIFENAEIANIAVAPAYQHNGLGEMLMKHLEQFVREKGCEMIGLEVRVSNMRAINLYARCGFITMSLKQGYYKDPGGFEDAYRMMKGI